MAVNPLLSLQVQAPDVGQAFSNALLNVGRLSQIQQAQAERPTEQAQFNTRQQEIIKSLGIAGQQIIPDLQRGNLDNVVSTLTRRRADLASQGLPTDETDEALQLAQSNPAELLTRSQQAVDLARGLTVGKTQFGGQQTFKDTEGNLFFGTTGRSTETGTVESILAPIGASPAEPVGQVSLVSPLGQTAAEQLASEAKKAGLKEEAKLKAQKAHKPQIEAAVTKARLEAQQRGETFNELSVAKASLPGLQTAVGELRELSTVATSTLGGRGFDFFVKETGFGATKGATARAKFIAIVNNQVLPLLKQTFGAAFTVEEGAELKRTMGDPNASPAEKMVQLDAFIAQKVRDIETKETLLEQTQSTDQAKTPAQVIQFDEQGNPI